MRISNPPPGGALAVSVASTTPPSTFTTGALVTVSMGGATTVQLDATRAELFISNLSTTDTIEARDTLAATSGVGIPVPPGATLVLSTQAAVNLTTLTGTGVSVAINSTRNV